MKVTIYDVAKEADVSIATVSNAMNGKGKISPKKRSEILKIVERLQYQPSMIASALTGKKTYTLGLLIPDISNPFYSEIARAVENRGEQVGYSVIICNTDHNEERVDKYISLLVQKSVDGIIIGTGKVREEILSQLHFKGIPIAMIARDFSAERIHKVVVDDYIGGELAAKHLLALGHKRMAVLAEKHNHERVRGFQNTLEAAGIVLLEDRVRACDYKVEDGWKVALELFKLNVRPTALFCCNDLSAIGALKAAKELQIRVPEEVSIVSFDNTILSSVSDPPLTTIAQPIEYMGKLAVDILIKELTQEDVLIQRIVLPPELIVRGSTSRIV